MFSTTYLTFGLWQFHFCLELGFPGYVPSLTSSASQMLRLKLKPWLELASYNEGGDLWKEGLPGRLNWGWKSSGHFLFVCLPWYCLTNQLGIWHSQYHRATAEYLMLWRFLYFGEVHQTQAGIRVSSNIAMLLHRDIFWQSRNLFCFQVQS